MNKPEIKLLNHQNNSVVKLTDDQELELLFEVSDYEFEYDIWTNWSTGKFHFELPQKLENGYYKILLPCDNTGFFKLFIRYRENITKDFVKSDISLDVHVDSDWIYDAVVYNIFLRAFGAKEEIPGEGGTFEDVIDHMDELVDLGINVIYLNPFHLIGELYRKYNAGNHIPNYLQPGSPYSIKDPKSIDPEIAFKQRSKEHLLADPKKQFQKLVDAAHKRNIRVIMDLVFNHTSHDFVLQRIYPEWFLYKDEIDSAEARYLYPEDEGWGDAKKTVVPYDHENFSWTDTAQLNWEYMLPPAPNDPPPNTKKREMYEYFKSIPKYWIKEFGVDGFRCDVAYKIPSDFWYECITEAKKAAREFYPENGAIDGEIIFIAESFNINLKELFEAGFTYVYGDYSNKLFSPITLKGYLDYIYNIGTNDFPKNSKWFIFPECHDFDRATSKLVPGYVTQDDGQELTDSQEAAIRGNESRWALTACLPGMPMVFNGFEKVEWRPVDHVSYSKINHGHDIHEFIKKVNTIRHEHISLQKGEYMYLKNKEGLNDKTKIFAFARFTQKELMLVIVNMDIVSGAESTVLLQNINNYNFDNDYILKDLLTDKIYSRKGAELNVILGPGQSHIFLVEQNWG